MHHNLYLPALAALCIALASCALQPKVADSTDPKILSLWHQHERQMLAITDWQLHGKLGVRAPDNSGSGQISWYQQGATFDIQLRGPFGQGSVNISGTPQLVTLDIAGQGRFATEQPEATLQQQVGWSLPVGSLQHWIRGLPDPAYPPRQQLNNQGRLQSLQQADWQLQFSSYQQVDTLWLPRKIRLQRDAVRLTLVITQWLPRIPESTNPDE